MPRLTRIAIDPSTVWRALIGLSLLLIAIDVALQLVNHFATPSFPGWETVFIIMDVDQESSIPTWWAALLLTGASVVTALTALVSQDANPDDRIHLWVIAAIFVLLSIDEQAVIHEHLIVPLRERFGFGGLLFFAWVVPATVAVIVVIAVFSRFVFRQPPRIRRLLILAAGLYLTGALIFEMIGGWWSESHGPENLTYQSLTSFEELLEYIGASIYILAMLYLLEDLQARVQLDFPGETTG